MDLIVEIIVKFYDKLNIIILKYVTLSNVKYKYYDKI